jgi:hypothetical protein
MTNTTRYSRNRASAHSAAMNVLDMLLMKNVLFMHSVVGDPESVAIRLFYEAAPEFFLPAVYCRYFFN